MLNALQWMEANHLSLCAVWFLHFWKYTYLVWSGLSQRAECAESGWAFFLSCEKSQNDGKWNEIDWINLIMFLSHRDTHIFTVQWRDRWRLLITLIFFTKKSQGGQRRAYEEGETSKTSGDYTTESSGEGWHWWYGNYALWLQRP